MNVIAIIPELDLESYCILKTLIELDEYGTRISSLSFECEDVNFYPPNYHATTKNDIMRSLDEISVESLYDELPMSLNQAEIEDSINKIIKSLESINNEDFVIIPTFESEIKEVTKNA